MFSGLKEILIFVAIIIVLIMFTRFKAVRVVVGIFSCEPPPAKIALAAV